MLALFLVRRSPALLLEPAAPAEANFSLPTMFRFVLLCVSDCDLKGKRENKPEKKKEFNWCSLLLFLRRRYEKKAEEKKKKKKRSLARIKTGFSEADIYVRVPKSGKNGVRAGATWKRWSSIEGFYYFLFFFPLSAGQRLSAQQQLSDITPLLCAHARGPESGRDNSLSIRKVIGAVYALFAFFSVLVGFLIVSKKKQQKKKPHFEEHRCNTLRKKKNDENQKKKKEGERRSVK